ncbi:zinc-binding dehydrogenase [Streptomyces sp. NBC_01795]|uniref:zinc-binding dehydrogenase n=1 Tax=Streptomyces sp. NBC_01795 TaxID=2975943 RepID=UPI002DDAACE0|nr:zinc-binding dehydrogenase [Streptomyces sp. NBC_01795]WSA93938.1 zinc-binding dehydrogenase [Streptomyces sp. NBC_01795]
MHAVRLHSFGPAGNLTYETAPDPQPSPGQVRIAVAAAGVHLLDATLRAGRALGPLPLPELPTIPGREVAGTVEALGEGTDGSWLGRRVAVHLGPVPGGYAELAVADAAALQPLPDHLSFPAAVAMIGTGRTVMGVLRRAHIEPGDVVLVLSAAGGMGALLTQYAKHRGARVIGAAGGPAKVATAEGLGADLAVDYTRPDWADRVRAAYGERPVRHLFDGPGGRLARTALGLLARGSTHYAYGGSSSLLTDDEPARDKPSRDGRAWEKPSRDERAAHDERAAEEELPTEAELAALGITRRPLDAPFMQAHKRELEDESLGLAAKGVLTPLIHTFPLAETAQAHHALETRATSGKVTLVP